MQSDILDLLLLNARVPEERRGDYFAQVAACRLGVRRIGEMIEARGVPMLEAAFDEIIRRTARTPAARRSRASRPANTRFEDVMDDDGVGTTNIPIKLRSHRAAARQQPQGAVRFHRHRAAGEGQHQLDRAR